MSTIQIVFWSTCNAFVCMREILAYVVTFTYALLMLREFIDEYYHTARPHQGLDGQTPVAGEKQNPIEGPSRLISFPVCGGLHHRYERVAA